MKVLGKKKEITAKPLETIHENKIYLRLWPGHTILSSKDFWTANSWKLERYSVEMSLHVIFFHFSEFAHSFILPCSRIAVCCWGSFLILFVSTEFTTWKKIIFFCINTWKVLQNVKTPQSITSNPLFTCVWAKS